jgi:hypothetical protein
METADIKRYFYEVYTVQCAISGFRRAVPGNCALLDYYPVSSGYFYLLCNKPEERSFQVNTNLWVHRFACWLLTDRNGTAIIVHKVHSVNQIIEITDYQISRDWIQKWRSGIYKGDNSGTLLRTVQVRWERYIFGVILFICFGVFAVTWTILV